MKLVTKALLIMLLFAVSIAGMIYLTFHEIVIPDQLKSLKQRAKSLTVMIKHMTEETGTIGYGSMFTKLQQDDPSLSYLLLVDTSGRAIFHSNAFRVGMIFNDSGTLSAAKYGNEVEQIYIRDKDNPESPYHGERVYDILSPLKRGDETVGAVNVGLSLKSLDELESKYSEIMSYLFIVTLVIIAIGVLLLLRNIIFPIKELVRAIKNMRTGDYNPKLKKDRKDEIGLLFTEFHKTSDVIAKLMNELKDSEHELKVYIDRLPNINLKLSLDGKVILANSITLKCLSFEMEDIKNKYFWELFIEGKIPKTEIKNYLSDAVRIGRVEFEHAVDFPGCKDKIISFTLSHVKDESLYEYFVVDGIDITEKRAAINELKRKSSEIKALFDNVPGYLYFKDLSGKYVACNQKFLDLVQKDLASVYGKTDFDLFGKKNAETYKVQDEEIIRTGKLMSIDEEELNDNGKNIIIMKRKVPLRDETGNIIGIIGLAFDISQLKLTEKALKDSEARFRSLVQNIPFGVVEVDYEGNITFANDAILKISGYTAEEIYQKKNWDFAATEEEKRIIKSKLSELKEQSSGPKSFHFSSKRKSGEIIDLQVDSNVRMDNSGRLLGFVSIISDITEKKRIQTELINSEEKYRNIFEKSSLGIYRTTLDGEILDVNHSFAKMFGYDSVEDLKAHLKFAGNLYADPSDRKLVIEKVREKFELMKFEIKFRKKDNTVIIGNLNIKLIPDEHGVHRILEGFIEDITERVLYEKQIKEQLVFLQTLIDTIPSPIFYRNDNLFYEGCNTAYEALLGRARDNIIGKTVHDVFSKDLADLFLEKDIDLLKNKRTQIFELSLINQQDKELHDYVAYRAVFYHIDGSIAGIIGILFDVTDRKQNERDIKQKLDLLDIAPVSLFVIDMNSKILYWNKGSELLYKVQSDQILGKDLGELMIKGVISMQEYSYFLNTKESVLLNDYWEGEIKQINNEGKELIIESKAKLARNPKGEAEYVLIVNLDVTERKKLENQLLLSQRLESLGTLASGIAHDLNNMLSPIVLGLDIIKGKLKDGESLDWIKTLQDTAKRGSDLVKQILSFARGLSDKFTFVQLRYIISEFTKIIKGTFPKSIQISKNLSADLWAVMGDSTQINQLLMNLCVNARDAMPEGGNLKITAENIYVDENLLKTNVDAKLGPYVLIKVSDTGSGIDPKIITKIFDPFFTTKEPGKGTGLGLSTVFNIVKNHKGFMNIYSEVGKGTSFKIFLPAMKDAEKEPELASQIIPYGKQELILIVDDETAVREIIRATLEAYGYEVISATNGAEAVALFAKNLLSIKAAIVDMIMPVMDGSATIEALKTVNPDIKIIASSGFDDAKDKPIMDKVNGFLAKPFTAEAILKLLAEVLNG